MTAVDRPAKEQVIVTKEYCLALVGAITALRDRANSVQADPQYASDNGVGKILRHTVEQQRQGADLLSGWFKRFAPTAGLNPEDFDV